MMETLFNKMSSIIGKGRMFKILFNLSPMYRRTGGRVIEVSDNLQYVKIRLPLNYKTKNYVGTIYGGHMYGCVDGIYMVQLISILGKGFVVWDKSANIRFRRPGDRTLYAEFILTDKLLDQIRHEIDQDHEKDFKLGVALSDSEGNVYAEIEKVIYIGNREYYRRKRRQSR